MAKNFKNKTEDDDFERKPRKPRREAQSDGHRPGEACECTCNRVYFRTYIDASDKVRCIRCSCLVKADGAIS